MPLLFINLLENAFKHGVEKLRNNAYVYLDLKVEEQAISFTVENNFDPEERPEEPGIGLANLQRRLELVYPGQHELLLQENNNVFRATLTIQHPDNLII
jgi:LytS/YehU family sensor histidine kinase